MNHKLNPFFCLVILLISATVNAADTFVDFSRGALLLAQKGGSVSVFVSSKDNEGVRMATQNLCTDISKVCGAKAEMTATDNTARIIVGTLGKSDAVDKLVREHKLDVSKLEGKTEMYLITVVDNLLVIVGSDRRGTIYGIYELSRQMGVSPWYFWADVPVPHHDTVYVKNGVYTDGEPAVRYRGIFLNDEGPCLMEWVRNTYGTNYGDHRFYEKVFELILRLKGNYMWPAMWAWAFYADDPLNGPTADKMGVMVGTSHHEPMSRSQKEWKGGKWDYSTNKENLDRFWLGGVERNRNTEDIVTIGMRGDGDMAMSEERNVKLLEEIVANQRKIIEKARGKKASEVPQLWALYKEVLDYYDDGMRVPDDVTILLCDDNWGNIRRVPTVKERKRKGGWGLYYHVDYVGAPRNSKWINATPSQNMWEQLSLAYVNGIDRLWILNVGDLKPMEYPIQLFMDMAWNPASVSANTIVDHTRRFCAEQFGEDEADEAARILNLCCKLNGRSTAEMLDATTYSLATGEWQRVVMEYQLLELAALRQYAYLPEAYRDAYFELILFPVEAMSNLYQMYYAQAQNNALHEVGDATMNEWADECEKCFRRDAELMKQYNEEIVGGKWRGMMIQKHIGYTTWQDNFPKDIMPKVFRADNPKNIFDEAGRGYVVIEAEHFASKTSPQGTEWTVIPYMGRTLSAVTLMPQTAPGKGSSLNYRFGCSHGGEMVTVHIITKSTLDYLNQGGLKYSLSLDGCDPVIVNFNYDLDEKPEHIYSIYYPTIARRVVDKVVELPIAATADFLHTLTFYPLDPGIVLEKIVIDLGGYQQQYLFGEESKRK